MLHVVELQKQVTRLAFADECLLLRSGITDDLHRGRQEPARRGRRRDFNDARDPRTAELEYRHTLGGRRLRLNVHAATFRS